MNYCVKPVELFIGLILPWWYRSEWCPVVSSEFPLPRRWWGNRLQRKHIKLKRNCIYIHIFGYLTSVGCETQRQFNFICHWSLSCFIRPELRATVAKLLESEYKKMTQTSLTTFAFSSIRLMLGSSLGCLKLANSIFSEYPRCCSSYLVI